MNIEVRIASYYSHSRLLAHWKLMAIPCVVWCGMRHAHLAKPQRKESSNQILKNKNNLPPYMHANSIQVQVATCMYVQHTRK
jgi:hypothetical protein